MKLERTLYSWAIGTAWTISLAAPAYGNEISIETLRNYFTSSLTTADPNVMVIFGVGLIALRVLMARRSKRREKDSAHS